MALRRPRGSSSRPRWSPTAALRSVVALLAVAAATGCSSPETADEQPTTTSPAIAADRGALVAAVAQTHRLSTGDAECVVEVLDATLTDEELARLLEGGASALPRIRRGSYQIAVLDCLLQAELARTEDPAP